MEMLPERLCGLHPAVPLIVLTISVSFLTLSGQHLVLFTFVGGITDPFTSKRTDGVLKAELEIDPRGLLGAKQV